VRYANLQSASGPHKATNQRVRAISLAKSEHHDAGLVRGTQSTFTVPLAISSSANAEVELSGESAGAAIRQLKRAISELRCDSGS
jgi:hypothetical protein